MAMTSKSLLAAKLNCNTVCEKFSSCLLHLIPVGSARAQTHADLSCQFTVTFRLRCRKKQQNTKNVEAYMSDIDKLFMRVFLLHGCVCHGPISSGERSSRWRLRRRKIHSYGHRDLLHVVTLTAVKHKVGSNDRTLFCGIFYFLLSVCLLLRVVSCLYALCGKIDSVMLSHFQYGRGQQQLLWVEQLQHYEYSSSVSSRSVLSDIKLVN